MGVELINYYRSNAGGSTLGIKQDLISLSESTDCATFYKNSNSSGFDVISDGLDKIGAIMDSNQLLGSVAFVAGVVAAPIALIGNHISNVSKNESDARRYLKSLENTADEYVKQSGVMLRTIEIIESIYNANKGFLAIYEPLRKRTFSEHGSRDIKNNEIMELGVALQRYKKISDTKIN